MSQHRTFVAITAALLVAVPALAPEAGAQDRTADLDRIFGAITPATPGCAVGVSQRGRVVANRSYGLADVARNAPLGPDSRFDIGSTQKQFVAAAVLRLVEDGRLALTDDVRKHLPELPDYGRTITIDHLLTHTSGIRDWTGLLPMAEEGTDVTQLILRQRGLNFAPGEEWSYSNSGFVLLKEIVARTSRMSFADFARTRLFEPLGMTASAYVADVLQGGPNAALGYQKDGAGWKPFMRLGNNRGGGAIVSTVRDLLVWNDALASGRLGPFVTAKLQERTRLRNGRLLQYARGLIVDSTPGRTVVSHSGGAAGFSTWMGRMPEHGLSVAVSCNFDPVSATALASRVAELYLPPRPASAQATAAAAVAAAGATGLDVSARAGLFFDERTGEPMRLLANEGRLRIVNGPALVTLAADRFRNARGDLFFRSQDEFELRFVSDDRLEIRSMEGQTTRYRRAQPWTPSAADLQAVAGRYESRELGATFEIVPGANGLVLRAERTPDRRIDLAPAERDTYMQRMMFVRFRRDAGGRVVGFDYGNPLVRGLAFTRVGDLAAGAAAVQPPASAASGVPAGTPAAGSAPAAKDAAPTAPVAAPKLDALVGEYEIAAGRTLLITLEEGRLHAQPTGSERRTLAHVAGATFSAAGTPITLTFTLGADGRATGLVMQQNGRERTLSKLR